MDLIKDTEVAALLNVAVNADITSVTKAINADVKRGTGRAFDRRSRTVRVRGYGHSYLFLPEAPIFAVTEVRIDPYGIFGDDTVVTDITAFRFASADHPDRELDFKLIYTGGYFPEPCSGGAATVMVTFDAGYYAADDVVVGHDPKVPEDLRRAAIVEAAQRCRLGAADKLASASLGDFNYTRRGESESEYRRMIRGYRRPV